MKKLVGRGKEFLFGTTIESQEENGAKKRNESLSGAKLLVSSFQVGFFVMCLRRMV
jgi:hypothetical protein